MDRGPSRHPRERRPRSQALPGPRSLCLACSPPAASLARPLGSSDSHYSLIPIWHPLCAHARHSFLRLLFCVCAANSFNDLFQRLQNVLNQLAYGMFSTPSTAPEPEHTHTYWHISRSHGPLPGPLPFLLPLSSLHTQPTESSHHRLFRKPICRKIWAHSASHWTLCFLDLPVLGRPRAQTCALSAGGSFGLNRK